MSGSGQKEPGRKALMETVAKPQSEESMELIERKAASLEGLPSVDEGILLPRLRLLWDRRRFLAKVVAAGLLASTLLAFLIPKQYESTAQLMPPDSQSSSSLAMLAGLSAGSGGGGLGMGMLAGDLLGIKSNGALFVGVLRSRTVADRIVDRFDLRKVYGKSLQIKAREKLAERRQLPKTVRAGSLP